MNLYFACSITGGRAFEPVYQAIISALLADGHEIPTAHLADGGVKAMEQAAKPIDIYERDTAWIRSCDALVAEVSTPSHGVGYEVAFALSLAKPVLCVFQAGQAVSKMLTGNTHPQIRVNSYHTSAEAVALIRSYLNEITSL